MSFPRRRRQLAHGCLGLLALQVFPCTTFADTQVKLGFVGEQSGSAWAGARQGLSEGNVQGEFLGLRYALGEDLGGVTAIVAAVSPAALKALARAHPGVAVLNVGTFDDAVRHDCLPNLLHVLPSAAMLADAAAQWQKAHPGSTVEARGWHPDFEKYAASQLNHRYRDAAGSAMDDAAWAGWAAVKLVSDTVAREQTSAPDALLKALRGPIAFDGQKGVDLNFRDNGQLRQPLLLATDGKLVGEAPVRGVADTLDSLGPVNCADPATP